MKSSRVRERKTYGNQPASSCTLHPTVTNRRDDWVRKGCSRYLEDRGDTAVNAELRFSHEKSIPA